jgi:hypothetical protein
MEQSIKISERGRIPATVVVQYETASRRRLAKASMVAVVGVMTRVMPIKDRPGAALFW